MTYGPEDEVVEQLGVQTQAWKDRFAHENAAKGRKGYAWRSRAVAEVAEAKGRERVSS